MIAKVFTAYLGRVCFSGDGSFHKLVRHTSCLSMAVDILRALKGTRLLFFLFLHLFLEDLDEIMMRWGFIIY